MAGLLERLLAETDPIAQQSLVDGNLASIDEALMLGIKEVVDEQLRVDVHRAGELCDLMSFAAERTGAPLHRALYLRAKANVLSLGGTGDYECALEYYDEAAAIYGGLNLPLDEARAQIGKVRVLGFLGRYEDAVSCGRRIAQVLEAHEQWLDLGKTTMNLGILHFRQGADAEALAMFDRAKEIYARVGISNAVLGAIARAENNRAPALRNLGRFEESIKSSRLALELLEQTHQPAEIARNQQNLGITYVILGRYNEALALLGKAHAFFLHDDRQRDAILTELFRSDCLLELHRLAEVVEKTQQAEELFGEYGTRLEVAQAMLNEATAYAGLFRHEDALAVLDRARRIFLEEGNAPWVASADLQRATVLCRLGRQAEGLMTARTAEDVFEAHDLTVQAAEARLVAARAAMALGQSAEAAELIEGALRVGEASDLPSILHPCHHLLSRQAEGGGDLELALVHLDQAIAQLERLRRQLMVEHRVDFLEDKQAVYEDAVSLCLALDRPNQGFEYVERAKSRALLEMLDYRLNIGIEARCPEDQPLVDELVRLKGERDVLYRQWQGKEFQAPGWTSVAGSQQQVQQQVLTIEKRITQLWHELLVRNDDYSGDASLWQVQNQAMRPSLPPDTLLIEYFTVRGEWLAFLVTHDQVRVCPLPATAGKVEDGLRFLQTNLKAAAGRGPESARQLIPNAKGLLQRLHKLLVAPLSLGDSLPDAYPRWIIVPHGALHYLPFHALHDGEAYLATRHEISYLPSAGLLRHVRRAPCDAGPAVACGVSYGGLLPYACEEARSVAEMLKGECYEEGQATFDLVQQRGSQACVLHLATHGEFRPDNPLFSGLALSGRWLTTLDIFSLRLQASLATLSACQTGQSALGGGDELLGLARAFLSAGAASLLLSLWPVEDRSTADFMRRFYTNLKQGATKGEALAAAQKQFIEEGLYNHPYYWAPFVLMGDTGSL